MISPPRRQGEYADREIDCQEAMEPGFQAIVDLHDRCGLGARGGHAVAQEAHRCRQHDAEGKMPRVEAQLVIARAMMRFGRP
ncbi:hypothetical protein [Mesorhizobium sp. M0306]|uniref:hypothetical protein n=1 Tax=unclassified Mesorhizobium TaxID=325217 RepID=UPI0033359793